MFLVFVRSCEFLGRSNVVIWDVSLTKASPILLSTYLVGVLIIKMLNFSGTGLSIMPIIAVQMLGALPLPCPTPGFFL